MSTPRRAWPEAIPPARVEIRRLSVPLVSPRVAAHGTEVARESILIAAEDADGRTGWGECVALARPTYTGEWIDGAWPVVTDVLVPAALAGLSHGVVGHPMAVAAVDDALTDLALTCAGATLGSVLGSAERVTSRAVIGVHASTDELVAAVDHRIQAGHRAVKLKVEPRGAVASLVVVRDRWPDLDLAVDANGSFAPGAHDDVLRRIDDLALTYIEQPFAADDLLASAELRRSASTPIALDESATSLGALRAARALGALDLVNVKPGRWGGVRATVTVVDALVDLGVDAFVGGMYELGLARASALALAAMPHLIERPTDLGPSAAYVAEDVTPPHLLDPDGRIAVPAVVGTGPDPVAERLDRWTTARVELRP